MRFTRIIVTAAELADSSHWHDFCDAYGVNPWALNEGLMSPDEEFEIKPREAKAWGLIDWYIIHDPSNIEPGEPASEGI